MLLRPSISRTFHTGWALSGGSRQCSDTTGVGRGANMSPLHSSAADMQRIAHTRGDHERRPSIGADPVRSKNRTMVEKGGGYSTPGVASARRAG
jgi:hypothetical protein